MENATVVVTGGTGSLGQAVILELLAANVKEIRVLSRSERSQALARLTLPSSHIRWFLGDVQDAATVRRLCQGATHVIHTAAMKHVNLCEQNAWECVQTNVVGTKNVADACVAAGVTRLVSISTDKASSPESVYGYSKYLAEKVVGETSLGSALSCISVRFGNLFGSQGSVLDVFTNQALRKSKLTITNPKMTRFFVKISDAAKVIVGLLSSSSLPGGIVAFGGKVARLDDLVAGFIEAWRGVAHEDLSFEIVGPRPGERVHERIIGLKEGPYAQEVEVAGYPVYWIEGPDLSPRGPFPDQCFTSNTVTSCLSVAELAQWIKPLLGRQLPSLETSK